MLEVHGASLAGAPIFFQGCIASKSNCVCARHCLCVKSLTAACKRTARYSVKCKQTNKCAIIFLAVFQLWIYFVGLCNTSRLWRGAGRVAMKYGLLGAVIQILVLAFGRVGHDEETSFQEDCAGEGLLCCGVRMQQLRGKKRDAP